MRSRARLIHLLLLTAFAALPILADESYHEKDAAKHESYHLERTTSRKLLQRGRRAGLGSGRGVRGGGRAGAVRVGGGGFRRPSMGRTGAFNNLNRINFGRGAFIGGINRPFRLVGGVGGGAYYDDGAYFGGGRALSYQAPMQVQVPVPVPVPVPVSVPNPVEVQPPVPNNAQIIDALQGIWRGDGGGAGMGAIVVTVHDESGGLTMSASPTGCDDGCAAACRWASATGPVKVNPVNGRVTVAAVFVSCPDVGKVASTNGSLEMTTNGRNVMYWSPATHSTMWIKNPR